MVKTLTTEGLVLTNAAGDTQNEVTDGLVRKKGQLARLVDVAVRFALTARFALGVGAAFPHDLTEDLGGDHRQAMRGAFPVATSERLPGGRAGKQQSRHQADESRRRLRWHGGSRHHGDEAHEQFVLGPELESTMYLVEVLVGRFRRDIVTHNDLEPIDRRQFLGRLDFLPDLLLGGILLAWHSNNVC